MNNLSVIKYEGDNNNLVFKYPIADFNTLSQLIVHESQEAIFFRNGQALDLFGPGRHTLKNSNIPFLKNITNIPTNGDTPFHCEIYFINKVYSMNLLWGTPTQILIQDPVFGISVSLGASGQFAIRINNSRKFLIKLVGTLNQFTQESLTDYFRGILLTKIKENLSNKIMFEKISILEINSHLSDLSEKIGAILKNEMEIYGIELVNFYINNILIPEKDESIISLKKALADRNRFNILGTNYQQERTFNILESAASNEGTGGSLIGAGLGIGMGGNIGAFVGEEFKNSLSNIKNVSLKNIKTCSKCGRESGVDDKFCSQCGSPL